jgi:hypothetical protein
MTTQLEPQEMEAFWHYLEMERQVASVKTAHERAWKRTQGDYPRLSGCKCPRVK